MKNIADSIVRCQNCGKSFTLRELGQVSCQFCGGDINDPVLDDAIAVPEEITDKVYTAFMSAHDDIVFGAQQVQDAIESFRAAVRQAEEYLQAKAASTPR